MAKSQHKTVFVCQQCGKESPRWLGRCPECQEWNSFVERAPEPSKKSRDSLGPAGSPVTELCDVVTEDRPRLLTPISGFNRVLGGGIGPGSLVRSEEHTSELQS